MAKWNTTINVTTLVGATLVVLGVLIILSGQALTIPSTWSNNIFWAVVGLLLMGLGAALIRRGSKSKGL